ncbi:MAG TPA: extracellular solute-binding protein [Candidatus Binatia bacterium]|nr:extracellular solute-binding protein [Candidatus Binatia bacterium]
MKPRISLLTMIWLLCWPYVTHGQTSNPDLIAQAKKEGRLTWYTTVAIPESKQFIDMFEKQYPFIKVDLLRSGSGPLVNRIVSEYAAKNYAPDVLHGVTSRGGFTALRQRNIIGRYESPERKFYAADLKDKEGYWSSTFQNTFVLAYNKRNVKPDDVPKTYDDLLKPIWKGRQIINDTDNFEWFDGLLKYWGRDKGMAYFRRLAQQDQIFQRGARGRVQLVAAGEAPLTIAYGPHAQSFLNQGAPIEWVPLEPVVVIINGLCIAQRAPHPAAAKLFIDFLLSKTAQVKLREMSRIPSRSDVESDPPRLIKGFKKVVQDIENESMAESIKLFQQTFGLTPG